MRFYPLGLVLSCPSIGASFFFSRVSCPSWNMDNSMVPRVVEDCDGTRISLDVDNDNNVLLSKRSLVGKMLAGKTRWER